MRSEWCTEDRAPATAGASLVFRWSQPGHWQRPDDHPIVGRCLAQQSLAHWVTVKVVDGTIEPFLQKIRCFPQARG